MNFLLKRRLTMTVFFLRMTMMGIQYSVILPSCLLYLKRFHASNIFSGFVVAAYPFSGMFSATVFGRIYDKTLRCKEIISVMNVFQIIGNILYSLAYSKWFPLFGRLVAGVGDSFFTVSVGEVCQMYPKSYRTAILSVLELGRVFGLLIGPLFNFLIGKSEYSLWGLTFDYTTFPGLLMICLWMIMQIITCLFLSNIAKETFGWSEIPSNCTKKQEKDYKEDAGDSINDVKENLLNDQKEVTESSQVKLHEKNNVNAGSSYCSDILGILSLNLIVIFSVDIILWFSQTLFEILMPFVTEFEYSWRPSITSIVYVIGGAELLVVFFLLYNITSRMKIRDTVLLLTSLLLTLFAMVLLVIESKTESRANREVVFGFICAFIFAALPINMTAAKALLSKITMPCVQGITQGLYATVCNISLNAGPIVGSLVFHHRFIYGCVCAVVILIAMLVLLLRMESIHQQEDDITDKIENQQFVMRLLEDEN